MVSAVSAACEGGRVRTAITLVRLAVALAGQDATEQTLVAAAMIDCARTLDEGLVTSVRQ